MTYDDDIESLAMSLRQAEEWLKVVNAGVEEEKWASVMTSLGRVIEVLGKASFDLGHLVTGLEIKRQEARK